MTQEEAFERLQEWKYLVDIRQSRDRALTITVRIARCAPSTSTDAVPDATAISAILPVPSETYEIHFPSFLSYLVSDESYCGFRTNEPIEGGSFARFQNSDYLAFVEQSSVEGHRPSPLLHYGIYCLDDLVDVISKDRPHIKHIPCIAD